MHSPRPASSAARRPTLLFYCQHSLGIGHLTRSFALAEALGEAFRVVFLNGGPVPAGLPRPAGVEMIDLPPLGMDEAHLVVSRDGSRSVAEARRRRLELILASVARVSPAVLLVELFPFGRKKFAGEILPLIRAARRQPRPARVVCSLRDILVDGRRDQQHHDDRARWLADRYFDLVLVHSDPAFARIDDSFRPRRPLGIALHYTGYVVPRREPEASAVRGDHLLVSAGGGLVGFPLFAAALEAHALLWPQRAMPLRLIAGPFLPEIEWTRLQRAAAQLPGVELLRQVPDMVAEMRRARLSLSQCGYNTALDLVRSRVPALVVPFAANGENEQTRRAEALAELGALQWLPAQRLDPLRLAAALAEALEFRPSPAALALDGAQRTTQLLTAALGGRAPARLGAPAISRTEPRLGVAADAAPHP